MQTCAMSTETVSVSSKSGGVVLSMTLVLSAMSSFFLALWFHRTFTCHCLAPGYTACRADAESFVKNIMKSSSRRQIRIKKKTPFDDSAMPRMAPMRMETVCLFAFDKVRGSDDDVVLQDSDGCRCDCDVCDTKLAVDDCEASLSRLPCELYRSMSSTLKHLSVGAASKPGS